ncbi:hypothetical protein M436DRAFT_61126 [Aureobasidium namibiae CBS 147.97]|uniref:Uncharacterized protein n=1 Tax=Aureobasidium namibiae CBS 147.97 TaxID=1043004 RepID=A0A074WRK4_9PEZI|nr:uncharacterized protein M436DRAFT_61126 [Aureobasidium namibiae CBS 147.97]KEQ75815.1 hypothetical protein M436DRAFT_61126 [Aureobasidium namibiae CBS 147.97]
MHMQEIITSDKPVTVRSSRWTKLVLDKLYKAMLELVAKIGEIREKLSPMMRKVIEEAEHFAHELEEFQEEHPILTASIETTALAVLIAVLAPFLLEALGFGVEGVVEGSLAARFQSLYPDVPYGSLFSKLQSFAVRYGKSLV